MTEQLLPESDWAPMPDHLREFLRRAIELLRADERLTGLAAGGSFAHGQLDAQSDLDLVIAVRARYHAEVVAGGRAVAATLGPLLVDFTGEHVGEPRLWICLYGPVPFHIDLKFVAEDDLADRVEDPVVLWDRNGTMTATLTRDAASYPQPDLQWIEDRFWVWVHYIADKITRGELFEAIDALAFVRSRVLGPMIQMRAGSARPSGVRRIEESVPAAMEPLRATLARHRADDCRRALGATVEIYRVLRDVLDQGRLTRRRDAEIASTRHAGLAN